MHVYVYVYNDKCSIIKAVSLEANIFTCFFTSGEYNYIYNNYRGYSCVLRNLARLVLKEFPTRPLKQIHYTTNVVKALASQVKSGSSTIFFGL